MTMIAPITTSPDLPSPPVALANTPVPAVTAPISTQAPEPASVETPPDTPQALQEKLDRLLEDNPSSLRFRVDEETQRVVVSVIDGSGEVVMQIPDANAIALAKKFADEGHLLDLHI